MSSSSFAWPVRMASGSMPLVTPGQKYKVTYRTGQQKLSREAVMVFISGDETSSVWSARPVAGTQILPIASVLDLDKVQMETKVYVNKVIRPKS